MAGLVVAAHITRTDLALGDLNLENPGTYRIVSTGRGGVLWARREATSDYVHGRTITAARKEVEIAPLTIRAYGASAAALESNVAALCRAFEQFSFHLTISIDSVVSEWRCECADYVPNDSGEWDKHSLIAHQQVYNFQVPRDPTPVQGAH